MFIYIFIVLFSCAEYLSAEENRQFYCCAVTNQLLTELRNAVTGSTDITVKNSEFHHNTGCGISCRQTSSYISVHRCICNGNVRHGVELLAGIANCLFP